MSRDRELSERDLQGLLPYFPPTGATAFYPDDYPAALWAAGINPRDAGRNTYIGITVTRPEDEIVVFGFAYGDRRDSSHDEDIYALDSATRILTKHRAREWERLHPEYASTHHGDKSYFKL